MFNLLRGVISGFFISLTLLRLFHTSNGQDTVCNETSECTSTISTTSGNINCYGYKACEGIVLDLYGNNYDIYCSSWRSCNTGYILSNNLGDIFCEGPESCRDVSLYIRAYSSSSVIDCSGVNSCTNSQISRGNELHCSGTESCSTADISYIENIYVDGKYGLQNATVTSTGVTGSGIMSVYLRGHQSGLDATLTCADSTDICYIYCQGTGCNSTTLTGSGTWVVDCDDSCGIICPIGYEGPSLSPTSIPSGSPIQTTPNPTSKPTTSPSGGSAEAIDCSETRQCQYQSLNALSVDCSGYQGCYGSGSETITSLTG